MINKINSKLFVRNLYIFENLFNSRKCKIYSTNCLIYLNKNSNQLFVNYLAFNRNESNNCFKLLSKRSFTQNTNSDNENEKPIQRLPQLMSLKPILLPNFWYKCQNFLIINTIIRPFFDIEFTLEKFIFGAKQALVHISNCLADGDIDSLNGVVTDEALTEILHNFSLFDKKQIQDLRIQLEDIIFAFSYRIGIIMNDKDDKRWVEITVVYYCLYKYQKLTKRKDLSFKEFNEIFGSNITVCNYRFIRDYTKGVESDWKVNLLGHFQTPPVVGL